MSGKPMAKLEENNQMFVPELVCENLRCCLAGMESSNASDRKLHFSRPTSPVRYVALFFGDVRAGCSTDVVYQRVRTLLMLSCHYCISMPVASLLQVEKDSRRPFLW